MNSQERLKQIGAIRTLWEISLALFLIFSFLMISCETQRTILDTQIGPIYRPVRLLLLDALGLKGYDPRAVRLTGNLGKRQQIFDRSTKFFCDVKSGPGRKSEISPTSVHRLRPGDIDIIGALGDSLTAGLGIFATNLFQMMKEERGAVWSIGGQGTWREFLTLPNILKEFNPNLYGYSLKDGLASERSSKFNVAELGAMSRDVPYEAKILVKRLQNDPRVNMTHHWKLVTLFIGNNDFCTDICYYPDPEKSIAAHERNMIKTYRYLRDNVPRLMLNVVPMQNLILLTKNSGFPNYCNLISKTECSCVFGKNQTFLNNYERLIKKWIAKDIEVAYRDEFNTETFTINVQPFTQFNDIPRTKSGEIERTNLSYECFHLSQKGQASSANSLWNNMLEVEGEKSIEWKEPFENFKCPTKERPFFATRTNSKSNNLSE